jgi:lipid-binding SYLF domain-containing protein
MNAARLLFFVVLSLALVGPSPAHAQVDQQQTVNSALSTIERLRNSEGFAKELQPRLQKARAVLIVPSLYKGGFVFGAQYGNGVLLGHLPDGTWSYPAFYTIEGGSFGLQIGMESASIVFLVMSDKALNAILSNQFKFGADTGVTFLAIGAGINASTTSNLGADIIAFSLTGIGLYGGLSLEGTILAPRETWNASYYGKDVASRALILDNATANPDADKLRDFLASK